MPPGNEEKAREGRGEETILKKKNPMLMASTETP
jgi:hypothetical protein